MKTVSELNFIIKPASEPPTSDDQEVVIAFVPGQGFQSCKYYNGSKTWQSVITKETVEVTEWLKKN